MPEIVTDQSILRKKSKPANDLEIGDIIQQLSISIPDHTLGLAAPQINIHKRVFLANLSSGSYAFINPEMIWESPNRVPSQESCLSLPGIYRCIERRSHVHITCYKLIDMKTGELTVDPEPMKLKHQDAFIVQHENDHLNGVLIVNHPMTMTQDERVRYREKKRVERIDKARESKAEKFLKTLTPPKPQKLSVKSVKNQAKNREAEKRKKRTARRQEKIRVEIQEIYSAENEGLFSKDKSPASDAGIKDD